MSLEPILARVFPQRTRATPDDALTFTEPPGFFDRADVVHVSVSLFVEQVGFEQARALNRLWHSRLPRLGTGCIRNQPFLCYAATCGGVIYAVAIWSNPVARRLPQQTWLELRRLAIAPNAPRNTASRILAVMARLIRKARPEVTRLISYQDCEVHTGTIYKAAGWRATRWHANVDWACSGRARPESQSKAPKQRWEKVLRED